MTVTLIVTVDTEEDDAWNGGYAREGHTFENVRHIGRFQKLCENYDIKPTYLVDMPVVEDPPAAEILQQIHVSGQCEIGAHLHPWCTRPFAEELSVRHSYLCNLPIALQREKLRTITDAIEDRFGCRPTSFRAGRYGLDLTGFQLLNELNYRVDSSVIPYSDYSGEGGPNFQQAPCTPYIPRDDHFLLPGGAGSMLEVPLTVGFSRSNFDCAARARQKASEPWLRKLRAVGLLDRLGIARRIKLSPEQSDACRMKQLVNASLQRRTLTLVMSLHSSSLCVGCSPYAKTATDLERLYRNLEETFEYCRAVKYIGTATLTGFAESWGRDAA